ncbi:MAG: hypothetical protein HQL41_11330 [Alphaproteobacteria bacterium]|nr:hypothetical protein [Alphaproteobacteria bacterium]
MDWRDYGKAIAFGGVLPAMALGMVALTGWQDRVADAYRDARKNADLLHEHVSRVLENQEMMVELAEARTGGLSWDELGENRDLGPLLNFSGGLLNLFLIDPEGRMVAGTRTGPLLEDVSDRDFFARSRASPGFHVSGAFLSRFDDDWIYVVARRRGRGDRFDGVIAASMRVSYFTSIFQRLNEGNADVRVAIVRVDGEVIASHPSLEAPLKLGAQTGFMQATRAADAGSFRSVAQVDGKERIYAFRKIEGRPVFVSFGIGLDTVIAGWRERILADSVMAVMAAAVLTMAYIMVANRMATDRERGAKLEAAVRERTEEAERRCREAEAARAEADRANHAKARFLAAASHDLRQPFQALRLYLEVLRNRLADSDSFPAVEMASKALESGEELLAALLDVSTLEAGVTPVHRKAFAVQDVLASLANESAPVAAAKNLSLRVVPSGAIIDSDPVLLARMLRNLVVNAIRYTRNGGVLIGCRRRGDRLRIEVHDSGVGIPAAEHALIFEDFYQIDNEARDRSIGLGLGLSVVSRCARLLDHPLSLRSTEGGGSLFAIEVPLVPASGDRGQPGLQPLAQDVG